MDTSYPVHKTCHSEWSWSMGWEKT